MDNTCKVHIILYMHVAHLYYFSSNGIAVKSSRRTYYALYLFIDDEVEPVSPCRVDVVLKRSRTKLSVHNMTRLQTARSKNSRSYYGKI